MAGPLWGGCVCGSLTLWYGGWLGCDQSLGSVQGTLLPGLSLSLSFLLAKSCSSQVGRHGLPALRGSCPSRTSSSAKVTVPGRPEPLNWFQVPCPRQEGAAQAGPHWGVLTHPHLSAGLQQGPVGRPQKPLAPAFPNMPRFTFLSQPLRPPARPMRPSGARGGLPAQSLAPGAASPRLAWSRLRDQMTQATELRQHHLPGIPSTFPQP